MNDLHWPPTPKTVSEPRYYRNDAPAGIKYDLPSDLKLVKTVRLGDLRYYITRALSAVEHGDAVDPTGDWLEGKLGGPDARIIVEEEK